MGQDSVPFPVVSPLVMATTLRLGGLVYGSQGRQQEATLRGVVLSLVCLWSWVEREHRHDVLISWKRSTTDENSSGRKGKALKSHASIEVSDALDSVDIVQVDRCAPQLTLHELAMHDNY